MLKFSIHYSLHFIFPLLISLIFLLSMLVDLDHLLANPIFQENRCSINFHPLHSYIAIGIYFVGLFFSKTRILAIALLFHMLTDLIDCYL